MALTKQKTKQQVQRIRVQDVDLFYQGTGTSGCVPTVDPNHLSPEIWNQLLTKNEAQLTTINRNSVLLLDIKQHALIGVSQRTRVSGESDMCHVSLDNITVLDRTWQFSSKSKMDDLHLLLPNTTRHAHATERLHARASPSCVNADVTYRGITDCCTNSCARCKISAICLTGLVPFSLLVAVERYQYLTEQGQVRYVGDKVPRWSFFLGYASRFPTLVGTTDMKEFLRTVYSGNGYDVFLSGKNGFSIELQRVEP